MNENIGCVCYPGTAHSDGCPEGNKPMTSSVRERAEQLTARILVNIGHCTTEEVVMLIEDALTMREGSDDPA